MDGAVEDQTQWEKQLKTHFASLTAGFQKIDKLKDPAKQAKVLEDLTAKMRDCKRLIKEFDREIKIQEPNNPESVNKQLNERKQNLIKELNTFVALRKTYTGPKAGGGGVGEGGEINAEEGPRKASTMTNQDLMDEGRKQMDDTDKAIERSKKIVEDTINVGAQTAVTLKGQTEQMGRIVNELDTINFSIKKASGLVKEIGRQLATDRCIMFFLFIIFLGVIAIIVVKVVDPGNKSIAPIPGLTPPAPTGTPAPRRLARRLLQFESSALASSDWLFI